MTNAVQALSIDEQRAASAPTLWTRAARRRLAGRRHPAAAPDDAGELRDPRHGLYRLEHAHHRLADPPDPAARGQVISSTAARRAAEAVDHYAPQGFADYLAALGDPVEVGDYSSTRRVSPGRAAGSSV